MNEDELLEQKLAALEKGPPPKAVLAGDEDGSGLVRLAAAVQNLPHPQLSAEQSRAQKLALVTAARPMAQTRAGGPTKEITQPNTRESRLGTPQPTRSGWAGLRWLFVPATAAIVAILLIGFFALLGAGLWLSGPYRAQSARLVELSGNVQASRDGHTWRALSAGDRLRSGERVRTAAASQASLLFYNGTRTTLEPDSDLTLTRVNGDWGQVLRVVLTQTSGKTYHDVVPLRGESSHFMVFTPSGEASVHGTAFSVAVGERGNSRFVVDRGEVLVTNETSEVYLEAGQAAATAAGGGLEKPGYQFSLHGRLTAIEGNWWAVRGIIFAVVETTEAQGDPQVGQVVRVEGRLLDTGDWVADSIEPAPGGEAAFTFTGILETNGAPTWQISGQTLVITDQTKIGANLKPGSAVGVAFKPLKDGSWQALSIEALEAPDDEPTPTPTATPDPRADPSLSFEPDDLEAEGCQATFDLSGKLVNTAAGADDVAANVELGYAVIRGAEFVNRIRLDPLSWGTIAAGEQVNFKAHITLNRSGWEAASEGTEVKLRVFVAHETNRPEGHPTRLTITLARHCDETPTRTPTVTGTITLLPTFTATPTPSGTLTTQCTGVNPHPTGMKLAQRYGVPYEEIMGWFCQGFGFGEIDLAYGLSLESGVPVSDIFALRKSGLGWGQIKKLLRNWPTAIPSGTPTPTGTILPSLTPTPTSTQQGQTTCTGANPHPTGMKLAQRYGVPYEEIMGWFCQRFGFGEIDHAYSLSRQTSTPVAQIFDMRRSGMGWGEIRKALHGNPGNPGGGNNDGDDPGKGKKKKDK